MNSDVSVVIPVFNQARFVGDAVSSALGQTLSPLEVIVVDDGSTDETPEVLRQFATAPRVKIIRQDNRGVAAARNAGVAAAHGKYLAFLDADDIWLPPKLARQRDRFGLNPELTLVHCGLMVIDENKTKLREEAAGREGHIAPELLFFEGPVILGGGSGLMVPAGLFRELGGFDERMSTSADWDLFYRLANRGPVGFVPEILLQYRMHGHNMHGNIRAMRHDMLLGYRKAFAGADAELRRRRRYAYHRLHSVLAGSFVAVGQKKQGWKHGLIAVGYRPASVFAMIGRAWRGR